MNKKLLRTSAIILCAVLSISTLFTGCGQKVNTYDITNLAVVDSWMDTSETNGEVHTKNMQTVYTTDTQTITEIFVKEGQNVKKGDKLMAYDTSLTDIETEKKKLEVMELELALQDAEKNLKVVNSYKPMVITTVTPGAVDEGTVVSGYTRLSGEGTEESPYIYVVEEGFIPCDGSFVNGLFPAGAEKVWAVFQTRAGNRANGKIIEHTGICYKNSFSGVTMTFFDAAEFCVQEPTEPYDDVEMNSGFTAAEISSMRESAQTALEEARYKYHMADIEYQQMLLEIDNGIVTADLDSVVVSVNDPEQALEEGLPVIKLSADGGYVVQGTLSELELDAVSVGQKVKVTSWEHYAEYEAQVDSISTIPAARNGWTNGNTNVSYYPFTVYIDGSADLKEYEWVSVAYSSSGADDNKSFFYLDNAFILKQNGKSYAFVQGENATLEKRELKTGEILWGSYTKVMGGVTIKDRIAFPYDKNAKEGVKTVEAGIDELYSYYG